MTPEISKFAIVTGAGSGIGEAIAIRLARDGFGVCVNDIDADAAGRVARKIRSLEGLATAVEGDVSSESDCIRIAQTTETDLGPVTLLVNNAGHAHQSPIESMKLADFDRMFAVHVRGTFLMIRSVLNGMLDRRHGNIINMSSQLAYIGGVNVAHYSAAKSAVLGLTKSMARELSTKGVRVNAVAPGPIVTPLQKQFDPAWLDMKKATLPLGRFGQPEEVAATVSFLASDESALYVGQCLGPNSGDVML